MKLPYLILLLKNKTAVPLRNNGFFISIWKKSRIFFDVLRVFFNKRHSRQCYAADDIPNDRE